MVAAGLLVLSLFSLALGAPAASGDDTLKVFRKRHSVPTGFSYKQKADEAQTLTLRLALVQGNTTGLETTLYDVSNPTSANYGKHLSKAEVRFVQSS